MPQAVVPQAQRIILAPYKGRLFDFSPTDDRYFIHSYVTRFFQIYGNDCIIRGFEPLSYTISPSHIVTVEMGGGLAIADSTCLIIEEPTVLSLDVSPYDESGRLVVNLGYKNYHSLEENEPYFKLSYVTADGAVQVPLPWRVDKDRVVLALFAFQKAADGQSPQLINLTPRRDAEPVYVTIAGSPFQVAPTDHVTRFLLKQWSHAVGMEVVELTPSDVQRGYLSIDSRYTAAEVEVSLIGGLVLVNQAFCPPGVVPDYEVSHGRIHFRNGDYGDYLISGLSDALQAGDILRIEYYY